MTETDPDDYDWSSSQEIADDEFPPVDIAASEQAVVGFGAQKWTLTDGDGAATQRARAAILITWTVDDTIDDVVGLSWEVRRGSVVVASGRTPEGSFSLGFYIIQGQAILPATAYTVRAKYVRVDPVGEAAWTSAVAVTTDDFKFKTKEIGDEQITDPKIIYEAVSLAGIDRDDSLLTVNAPIGSGAGKDGGVSVKIPRPGGTGYSTTGPTFSRDEEITSKIGGTAGTAKMTLAGNAVISFVAAAQDHAASEIPVTMPGGVATDVQAALRALAQLYATMGAL